MTLIELAYQCLVTSVSRTPPPFRLVFEPIAAPEFRNTVGLVMLLDVM